MILFVKLLLAHLLGDFILQPNSWVMDKEHKKHKSIYLYIHVALHFALAWTLAGENGFFVYALALAIFHGIIDWIKLHFQKPANKRGWFIADQLLHVAVIIAVVLSWSKVDCYNYEIDKRFWLYFTAVVMLTTPASIVIKNIISIWTPNENDTNDSAQSKQSDLQNAGKYIGILERLFVFFFVVSGYFASIGFLMAAKSIFRFGDLTKSTDRKLTEYVLIGTLLSFGTAIATGFLVKFGLLHLP